MKYTLVLGIAYKKYKYPGDKMSPGDIAVYVGGRLIDSFQIEQDVTFVCEDTVTSLLDETWCRHQDLTRWLPRLETNKDHPDPIENHITDQLVPKLFKIYELEEQDLNGLVEITVDNSHSDHNNGFMKNSSMIRFPMMGLFPSHFIENKGEQLMRIVKKIVDGAFKHKKRTEGNAHNWSEYTWPCVKSFYIKRQNNIHEEDKIVSGFNWIGGSFRAEIPIKIKHRIRYLSSISDVETGFFESSFSSLILATCKPLLNIYNENQRSNRTKN